MPVENWSDNVLVAHLSDDPQFSDDLQSIDEALASNGPAHVVLDFAAVHFINSSNLARLLKLRKTMVSKECRLMLCAIPNQVWGTFLVTGLDKVFDFSDSVTMALVQVA